MSSDLFTYRDLLVEFRLPLLSTKQLTLRKPWVINYGRPRPEKSHPTTVQLQKCRYLSCAENSVRNSYTKQKEINFDILTAGALKRFLLRFVESVSECSTRQDLKMMSAVFRH